MASSRRFRRDLPGVPAARRYVAEVAWPRAGLPATDELLLVVSELATNAVRHGAGDMEVRVHGRDGVARVEVLDDGGPPVPGAARRSSRCRHRRPWASTWSGPWPRPGARVWTPAAAPRLGRGAGALPAVRSLGPARQLPAGVLG